MLGRQTAPSFGKAKKKPSPPKKEKVVGVVAAGGRRCASRTRASAGETGIVNGYRDGWHVVTSTPTEAAPSSCGQAPAAGGRRAARFR